MDFFIKFLKFGIVGASGVIVDFGITWLLKEWVKINRHAANSTGFFRCGYQ
jgi:putative flippase GtrA